MITRQNQGEHQFGGDWTERKLDVVSNYLSSYTTALGKQPFEKHYIDAFAGTGYRAAAQAQKAQGSDDLLFPDLAGSEARALLDGSARRALMTEPRFDRFVLIERHAKRCAQLEHLRSDFPWAESSIEIRQGDANEEIQSICGESWTNRRAVLFLDPYGMQVEWATIEAIAGTRSIDLWILFPLGIGVNRLLTKSGDIPEAWRNRLDLLLGRTDWYDEFYSVEPTRTLFGDDEERVVKASTETIGKFFIARLESVFAGVAPNPAVLSNSKGCPLYLLCFAVGNQRGRDVALPIANHLLREVS